MNNVFVRNYVIFVVILIGCAGTLVFSLLSGEQQIDSTDAWIDHSHKTIAEAEKFSSAINAMMSAQRGYIISGEQDFLQEYALQRSRYSRMIRFAFARADYLKDNHAVITDYLKSVEIQRLFQSRV